MDKSQFRLPESEYNDASNRARLESFRRSPEQLKSGPFEIVKQAERTMFDRRDTAVAIELKNGRTKTVRVAGITMPFTLPPRAKEVIYKELIERERVIGGSIFENGARGGFSFWLDHKGSSVVSNDVADWHLEMPSYEVDRASQGVHIETTGWQIRKFHKDGKPYAVTIQDIERFVPAAYHYVQETAKLYPFDQDFEEIVREMDLPENVAALLPIGPAEGEASDYRLAA